jgi:hypothetical protein
MDMMEHPDFPGTGIGIMNDDAACDKIIDKILADLAGFDRPEILGAIAILVTVIIDSLPENRRKPTFDQFIAALHKL